MDKYIKLFNTVTQLISDRYILLEERNIDWFDILKFYHELLSNVKDDKEFLDLINKMITQLKDPHVNFSEIADIKKYFLPLTFKFIRNHLICVSEGSIIPKGAEILELDTYKINGLFSAEMSSLIKMRFLNTIYGRSKRESTCTYLWDKEVFDVKLKIYHWDKI